MPIRLWDRYISTSSLGGLGDLSDGLDGKVLAGILEPDPTARLPFLDLNSLYVLGTGNSDPLPPILDIHWRGKNIIEVMDPLCLARAGSFGLHLGNKIGTAITANWPNNLMSNTERTFKERMRR